MWMINNDVNTLFFEMGLDFLEGVAYFHSITPVPNVPTLYHSLIGVVYS